MKHTFSVISDLLQLFWSFFILIHNATLIMGSLLLKKDWNNLKSVIDLYYLLGFLCRIFHALTNQGNTSCGLCEEKGKSDKKSIPVCVKFSLEAEACLWSKL